ncbi:hypothetical protein CDIMF43_140082 [Carnobacterium divergens]|nr:hypothetical protein CDIMF43_140082 [Carnobacterium divergens]
MHQCLSISFYYERFFTPTSPIIPMNELIANQKLDLLLVSPV